MPMATRLPIIIIHTGRFEGRLNASNNPVTIAEQSDIMGLVLRIYFCMTYSNTIHDIIDTEVTTITPVP